MKATLTVPNHLENSGASHPSAIATDEHSCRRKLIRHVALLASQEAQCRYERSLSFVSAHADVYMEFDYVPGEPSFERAFSAEEKQCLAEIERRMRACRLDYVYCMDDLWRQSEWKGVMQTAQRALHVFARSNRTGAAG